jgi:hypothetical protein
MATKDAPVFAVRAEAPSVDIISWSIATTMASFFINSASDPNFEGDTPISTAPGHHNIHPAVGVTIEITVAKIPNR